MAEERAAFHLHFEGLSTAEANLAAAELLEALEEAGSGIDVELLKERPETQDFGATIVVILGTKAAVILAKAVHTYVAKRANRVVITTPEGNVVATGDPADNIDVAQTVEALKANAR